MNNTTVSQLVPKLYPLLEQAVENGVACGWRRAHKHTDQPTEDLMCDAVTQAVLHEICERFHFVEPDYD
jgi:hypothetical protein